MEENKKFTFEEIFNQNQNRIHYQMKRLGIHDPDGEFYSEGLYAMWMAYKKYEPNKGPLSTYFNYNIRYRLMDLIRKKVRDKEKMQDLMEKEITAHTHGNRSSSSNAPFIDTSGVSVEDEKLCEDVFAALTDNQRKWVYYAIIRDLPLKEIARKEDVTVEAVKSWGKQARKKLREVLG